MFLTLSLHLERLFRTCPTLCAILGIVLFSFWTAWGTSFNFGLQGDDYWTLHQANHDWHFMNFDSHWITMAHRGYLCMFYAATHILLGKSAQMDHLFFFALRMGCAILLFLCLKKFFAPKIALLACFFFLSYPGAMECTTWNAAGAYWVVIAACLACTLLQLSNATPLIKALVPSVLIFISMHLYELPVPYFPILILTAYYSSLAHSGQLCWQQRGWNALREIIPSALSILFYMGLVIFWCKMHYSTPYWEARIDPSKLEPLFLKRAWMALTWGFDATIGPRFWSTAWGNFIAAIQSDALSLPMLATGAALLFPLALLFYRKGPEGAARIRPASRHMLLLGCAVIVLLAVTPLIAMNTMQGYMPERLTLLPVIGLSLLLAGLLTALPRMLKCIFIPCVCALVLFQSISFNSMLKQHETAWEYDQTISNAMLASHWRPQDGEEIHLSLPPHPFNGTFWQHGFSQLIGGHAHVSFEYYGNLLATRKHQKIELIARVRAGGNDVFGPVRSATAPKSYWFVDDSGDGLRVSRVGALAFVNAQGQVLESRQVAPRGLTLKQLAISTNDRWVTDRPIALHWVPLKALERPCVAITGHLHLNDPPFHAKMKHGAQVLAEMHVRKEGPFSWLVQLPDAQPPATDPQAVTIENDPSPDGKRVIWEIKGLDILNR